MMMLTSYAPGLAYVALAVVLLILSKLILSWLTPFPLDDQLTGKDNPALALSLSGFLAGVVIIFLGASAGPSAFVGADAPRTMATMLIVAGETAAWTLGGVLLLCLGRWILDKAILTQFSTVKEIVEDRNVGTGAVECGGSIATALIVAGSIAGTGSLITALVFYALSQVVFIAFGRIYAAMCGFDLHDEIEKDNVAAGVAFGGNLIALGIILLRASAGDFTGWMDDLISFGVTAFVGFVLLMILRQVTDRIILRDTSLREEIARDRNVGAAWLESVMAIGMASILAFMI